MKYKTKEYLLIVRLPLKEDTNLFSEFPTNRIYILIFSFSKEVDLNIGKLGKKKFSQGYYTYTGSASGKGVSSLKHRIARHLRKKKRKFWHIDYLLTNEDLSIEAVIIAETNCDMECTITCHLKRKLRAKVPVKKFGASDCRKTCGSHLLYFPEIRNVDSLFLRIVKHLQSLRRIFSVSAYTLVPFKS